MSNRRIESPDLNSDIELAPSGTKRAKVSHDGGIIIGSNANDADNVKLHRAATNKIEIVIGSDTTAEGSSVPPANLAYLGMKGIAVGSIDASEAIIGTSGTASDNIKLRRGGVGDLEFVTADEATAEGTPSYSKRTDVQMGSATVGASTTPSENVKLHRGGAGVLEFINGNDTTADGTEAVGVKVGISSKNIIIGSGANGTGGKIFRSGSQELECSSEDAVVVDGTRNPQYRSQINYKSAIVGASSTEANNLRLHRGQVNELELVKGNDTTTENSRSANKAQLNTNAVMLGSDGTLANNAKLHLGAAKELEVVVGSALATETDGTRSSSKAQINAKTVSVGNAGDVPHGNNVKLHRGNTHEMEVVKADDSTADSTRSANKVQLNSKDVVVGSDASVVANNVKLHRSGNSEIEFLSGSDNASTVDGTAYPASRAKVNLESLIVGKSTTVSENSKLHRYLNTAYSTDETELEVVEGADATADGAMSSSGRRNVNVKGLTVGQSATSSQNAKLHRGGNGIMEVVSGDDTTADGTASANKAQLSAKTLHVGTSGTDSQNIKFHRGANNVVQAVQGDDATAEGTLSTALNQMSFKYETYADGSEPVATGQEARGFWNSTFKQLEMSNGTSWLVIGENKNRHSIENVGFTAVTNANTVEVRLKDQAGNDPSNGSSVRAAFRDATLATETWYFRKANTAQLLTIDSGATLGTSNALSGRIYVYLIDNVGTLELAVSQKYYKDDSIVTTTTLSAAAGSVGTVYSETGVAGVAIKNIGYFESTQATAGTWVTTPSKIHIGDIGPKDDKDMSSSTVGPGDVGVSSAVSQAVTTKTNIAAFNVNLTTTGRPVRLQLMPGPSGGVGTPGKLELSQTGADFSITGKIYLHRGATEIAVFELDQTYINDANKGMTFSPSCIEFLDDAPAGVHLYNLSAEASSVNGLLSISNVKLIAYEL